MFSRWMQSGRTRPDRPVRSAPATQARVRLALEALEDRLVPSGLTYEQWQAERFSVDDVAIANVSDQANSAPQPVNQSFGSLIGLDRAFADYAYRGQGASVAIIDTGIDYRHADLGGGWGNRVIAGYDFVNRDSDPLDDNGHGTHVAGIVGSSSATYSGVAPNINLIALKVLDASGSGSFGNVEAALQWVVEHQAQYNIVAVNLSLGSGNYTSNPFTYLDDEFASLRSAGVFSAVAAGNSFYTFGSQQGLSFPAVSTSVVSVGAVWAKDFGQVSWMSGARDFTTGPDRVASFSQRGAGLDLVAPGAMITSTYVGGGYQAMAGTSMATPVVAGAAALIHQALVARGLPATQDAILQILQSSGVTVVDGDDESDNVTNSGRSFQRLDVYAALQSVGQGSSNAAPVLSAIPEQTISPGATRIVTLSASDADGDALSFSAQIVAAGNNLYQVRQQFGLAFLGDYFTGVWGQGEKWLGSTGGQWYCVLPNGELRRWAGTMSATLDAANLVATVPVACHADPSLLWNAQPGQVVPASLSVAGNQVTLRANADFTGSFQVEVSVNDGTHVVSRRFTVSAASQAPANQAPVWTPIADQMMKRSENLRIVTLSATDPEGKAITYSAVALPVAGSSTPTVNVSVQGNQLTIDPAAKFSGKFLVEVTASDGVNSSKTSFTVEVQNTAPTLASVLDRSMKRNRSATLKLVGKDADGDALTYSAKALPGNYLAYQLDQQLDLAYQGSYFQDFMGLKEKWMAATNATGYPDWYCILPNGEVRRHGGTLAATLSANNLVAKLDASYYANPQLLWDAKLQTPPAVTFKVVGNQVTITPPVNYTGTFYVEVAVSDGVATTQRTFKVKVS